MDATFPEPVLPRTDRGSFPKILASIAMAAAMTVLAPAKPAFADTGIYPGGTVAINSVKPKPSPKCKPFAELLGRIQAGTATVFDLQCVNFVLFAGRSIGTANTVGKSAIGPHIQAATTIAPSLALDTPVVPFLGNRLAGLGRFLSSTDPTVTPPGYTIALRRESNCHLTADFLEDPDAISPAGVKITSIADAQNYYHQLAGLTTTANTFAHGCVYPTLGQPTTQGVLLAGNTASGGAFAVSAANGLVVTASNLTANTFGSTTLLSNTAFQGGIAVADLNADGNLDIVATFATNPGNSHNSTAVFIGNGGGTFKPVVYYDFAGDVTVDDVNGDGKPDIVVVGQPGFAGTVTGITTLLGVGNGTFTAGPNSAVALPAMSNTSGVLAADFNNDTKKDLLVGGKVYLGAGDGSFTAGAAVTADTTLNFAISTPVAAIGDLNNDNKMDVVLSQPNFVAVFLGNGDGTFTAGPRFAALSEYQQVAITDIDGDGNADLFLGTSTGGIFLDGGATVSPELFQILMGRGDGSFVDSTVFAQPFIAPVAAADFTGDTKLDVLQLRPNANLSAASALAVLPGDGANALGTAIVSSINLSPGLVVATDMTKDGKPDVVLAGNGLSGGANAGPLVAVLKGQGNGTFTGELDYAVANNTASLAVGDFNGDGFQDIAVGVARQLGATTGATGVYVLLGQSNGTWAAPVKIDASLNPSGLAAGDLNGDGFADLVVADRGFFNFIGGTLQVNGAVHVYLGKADGSFITGASPTTTATNYSIAALGDLDGDGKLDLVLGGNVAGTSVGAGTPNVYTLKGVGDGTFQAATVYPLAGADGIGADSIALADFDHDGHLDVALGNSADYTEFLMGQGAGVFAHTLMVLGREPGALAAADLNGDNFPELLVVQNGAFEASLAVFRNADAWTAGTTPPVTAATTTTLTAAPSPVTAGQSLTLSAGVTSASAGTPTGSVTFFDGATSLGSAVLSSGSASLSTTTLAVGAHSLTATYAGDSAFGASTSAAVALTVNAAAANFAVSASPTSGSASAGASATTTLTLTPSGGFNQTVTLACSGLPSGASCAFSPASVAVAGSAATSVLTITTTIRTAFNNVNPLLPGGAMLAGMFVPIFVRRRRLVRAQKRGVLLTLLFAGALLLTGCHGHSSSPPAGATGTPAGTYAVTITATAGATSHTATYSLTVN